MSRFSKLIPLFACIALLATLAHAQIDNPAEEVHRHLFRSFPHTNSSIYLFLACRCQDSYKPSR